MPKQIALLLATLVIFVAVFVFMERTFSPTFQQCIATHQADESGNPPKENPSAFGIIVDSYVRCTGSFVKTYEAAISALATIIIAAFTGTLWFATSRQAELTREAFFADKRAFVFSKSLGGFWEIDTETHQYNWRFRPVWENSGESPTRQLCMYTSCELRNTALPDNFDFTQPVSNSGTGLIGPKSTTYGGLSPMPASAAITPQDLHDVQMGRKFLYLWGWVRYFDVFPGTAEHITRFAWAIGITGDPFKYTPETPSGLSFGNIYLARGNCADDECKLQGLG